MLEFREKLFKHMLFKQAAKCAQQTKQKKRWNDKTIDILQTTLVENVLLHSSRDRKN